MTTYNVVSPGAMVAGQPEDISVILANFNAIAAILNGGIDNANINVAAAIAPSKLAGYPSDASKALLGDSSWGAVSALAFRGDWAAPTTYVDGDVAVKDGIAYLCVGGPTTTLPDPTLWGAASLGGSVTNPQTGTTYTLVLGDGGNIVELLNASAIALTVPANSTVPYPIGTLITLIQTGAGQVTVSGAGGVTINANPGLKIAGQWGVAQLLKRGTDTWVFYGNIQA